MAYKLAIFPGPNHYHIGWYDTDDQDFGHMLGEPTDEPETVAATDAAMAVGGPEMTERWGLGWPSERKARKALAAAKKACAEHESRTCSVAVPASAGPSGQCVTDLAVQGVIEDLERMAGKAQREAEAHDEPSARGHFCEGQAHALREAAQRLRAAMLTP